MPTFILKGKTEENLPYCIQIMVTYKNNDRASPQMFFVIRNIGGKYLYEITPNWLPSAIGELDNDSNLKITVLSDWNTIKKLKLNA